MSTLAWSETLERRDRIFAALTLRNRFVQVLRFAVPALGVVIFGGLVLQLFFASLGDDFGFANISIDRNNLIVDTPSYSSTGADGSSFQLEAASAKSALDRTDIIDLTAAVVTITKAGGATITASTDAARLSTTDQSVTVDGVTQLADSSGMRGSITGAFANIATQTMVGKGEVDITFSNGAALKAANMSYDGASSTWSFGRATLTLPMTPGEGAVQPSTAFVGQAAAEVAGPITAAPTALIAPQPMPRRPLVEEQN